MNRLAFVKKLGLFSKSYEQQLCILNKTNVIVLIVNVLHVH